MWGQVLSQQCAITLRRIIPTRVGTSNIKFNKNEPSKDHPHACGDKAAFAAPIGSSRGSSPRVWGQEFTHCSLFLSSRIIPTRVGTSTSKEMTLDIKDGSSPRVWGQGEFIALA